MDLTNDARTRTSPRSRVLRLIAASALFVALAAQSAPGIPIKADCEELWGTASISGTVTDANTGDPVAGIAVTVRTADEEPFSGAASQGGYVGVMNPLGAPGIGFIAPANESVEEPADIHHETTTAEDGTYSVSELPAGTYTVEFGPGLETPARYYAPVTWEDPETSATALAVADGAVLEGIDAQMEASFGAVVGTVAIPEAGDTSAKVTAFAQNAEGGWDEAASVDADETGSYVLPLQPGTYRIGFDAECPKEITNGIDEEALVVPSFYPDAASVEEAGDVVVEVQSDSTADGELALNPNAAVLSGRVTDPEGGPVECAYVLPYYLSAEHGWKPLWDAKVKTDASGEYTTTLLAGTFRLKCIPNDSELAYAFYPSAGSLAESEDVTLTAGANTADFQLGLGGSLVGRLTDQLGRGPVYKGYWKYTVYRLVGDDSWEAVGSYASECADYELGSLPAGNYRLGFGWGGADWLQPFYYLDATEFADAADIEVAEGASVELQDARYGGELPTDISAWSSSGTVERGEPVRLTARLLAGTTPVKYARVRVYRDSGRGWKWTDTVSTGSTGRANVRTKLSTTTRFKFIYKGKAEVAGDTSAVRVRVNR